MARPSPYPAELRERAVRMVAEIRTTGDLLRRDFTASCPNERWVADFTYVATWSRIVYVAFAVDVFSRAIGDIPPHEHETNYCAQHQPQPAAGVNA